MLTYERLVQVLRYNQKTGVFTWRVTLSNRATRGSVAGYNSHGYRVVSIDGTKHPLHRLAIFYVTKAQLSEDVQVDHKNANRADNRFCNLRVVTSIVNAQNRRQASKNNKLQALGVAVCPSTGRFRAQIMVNRKRIHIGRFDTSEEASAAYIAAKRTHHEGNTL